VPGSFSTLACLENLTSPLKHVNKLNDKNNDAILNTAAPLEAPVTDSHYPKAALVRSAGLPRGRFGGN
jgi:hypothetical protein